MCHLNSGVTVRTIIELRSELRLQLRDRVSPMRDYILALGVGVSLGLGLGLAEASGIT